MASKTRSTMFSLSLSPSPWLLSTRAHNIGVSVSETKPESKMVAVMVTANSRNTRPTMPPINSTGMKTAINEMVIEMMVNPTSREPLSAASNGVMPLSMWRTMFSNMTMASSTTNPTDRVSAMSVRLLIEKLNAYIAAQLAMSEIGTASDGIMVAAAERRNRKITATTSPIAIARVTCTSLTELRTDTERSANNSTLTDGGIWAR